MNLVVFFFFFLLTQVCQLLANIAYSMEKEVKEKSLLKDAVAQNGSFAFVCIFPLSTSAVNSWVVLRGKWDSSLVYHGNSDYIGRKKDGRVKRPIPLMMVTKTDRNYSVSLLVSFFLITPGN